MFVVRCSLFGFVLRLVCLSLLIVACCLLFVLVACLSLLLVCCVFSSVFDVLVFVVCSLYVVRRWLLAVGWCLLTTLAGVCSLLLGVGCH